MSSNTTAEVMDARNGGSIHAMWIPCVVFAHIFAFGFLLRMVSVMYPSAWAKFQRGLLGKGKRASADGLTPIEAAVAAANDNAGTQGEWYMARRAHSP